MVIFRYAVPESRYAMLKSISILIVLAALGGCTTGSLVGGETRSMQSTTRASSLDTSLIGPMGRAYDCYYRGANGGKYVAQCPSGYH